MLQKEGPTKACGIWGLSLTPNAKPDIADMRVLTALLALGNDTRGGDSWGLTYPNASGVRVVKGLGDLFKHKQLKSLAFMAMVGRTMMVHHRSGRMGGVSVETSHPFRVGDIEGAHNGMIYNWNAMQTKYPDYKNFKVDSNVLIGHIAKHRDLGELDGYGAVEYVDTKNDPTAVFLGKITGSGDLYAATVDKFGVVWSSARNHLETALIATGLKFNFYKPLEPGHLYKAYQGQLFSTEDMCAINQMGYRGYTPTTTPANTVQHLNKPGHYCKTMTCHSWVTEDADKYCAFHNPKRWITTALDTTLATWDDVDDYIAASINSRNLSAHLNRERAVTRALDVALETTEGDPVESLPTGV